MHNLIKYGNNYAKLSGTLKPFHKDDPNGTITDSESFKFKGKITGRILAGSTKNIEITGLLSWC